MNFPSSLITPVSCDQWGTRISPLLNFSNVVSVQLNGLIAKFAQFSFLSEVKSRSFSVDNSDYFDQEARSDLIQLSSGGDSPGGD